MNDLINKIKASKKLAAENVVLVDLRNKGLIEDNAILRPVNGQQMQREKNAWFASNVGQSCLQPEILYNPEAGLKFLRERLDAAFMAGAEAQVNLLRGEK